MPRISVCHNIADIDQPEFSGDNEYLDYCRCCYAAATQSSVAARYSLPADAVDKCGNDHPDYNEDDCKCDGCGKLLHGIDN